MITIQKENTTKKVNKPHYLLVYNYMIGDADGETNRKVKVSLDNPFLERYVTLLNSLRPTKGTWGVTLTFERLKKHYKEKQITKDNLNFLNRMMFEEYDYFIECEDCEDFQVSIEDEKYANEFYDGVTSDTEYSFLVFEGCDLFFVDEFGKKHKTKIK